MALLACEVQPGMASFARFAIVTDPNGQQESLQVNADFLTYDSGQAYLPVGVVYQDRDRALIELPHQADSGTQRLWISPADLR
jgi:hypothetical protein